VLGGLVLHLARGVGIEEIDNGDGRLLARRICCAGWRRKQQDRNADVGGALRSGPAKCTCLPADACSGVIIRPNPIGFRQAIRHLRSSSLWVIARQTATPLQGQ
jgi:hypothetical protein